MIDIVFISPSNEKLGLFHKFVPRSVPLGIGILASYLIKNNYNVEIIDEEITPVTRSLLEEKIQNMSKPVMFGISLMTTNSQKGYDIARMIKEIAPDSIIQAGGIHPTVASEEVLNNSCIDFVIKGEGERATLALMQSIKTGHFDNISNLVFKNSDGDIQYNEEEKIPFDINELPGFPYELFNERHYDLGFILTSRGCPFNCIFCSQRAITKRRYRSRDNKIVLEELKYLINEKKQKNITFFDDFFTGDKKRVFELCKMIRENELHKKCSFGVQTRGDSIDREILAEMKKSGFDSMMLGFEVSSNKLMKVIKKGETVEDNINAILLGKQAGFAVEATFIFGFPEETYEDRINALQIAKGTGLDRARFNIATPYPGTELYEIAKSQNCLCIEEGWNNFNSVGVVTSGLFKPYKVPYCPKTVKPVDLAGEVFLANALFYLNLKNLNKLFNIQKSGSGKWFELPKEKIFNFSIWMDLIALGLSVCFKALYFLIFSNECKKFFIEGFLKSKKYSLKEVQKVVEQKYEDKILSKN